MTSIIGVLGTVKNILLSIQQELNVCKKIDSIYSNDILIYSISINELSQSINSLLNIWIHDIPVHHRLEIALVNNLSLKLNEFNRKLNEFVLWYNDITSNNLCCFLKCITVIFFLKILKIYTCLVF